MFTAQESPAETSFAAFQTRSNDDRLLIEITQSFAERVASSNLLDPEVRDSRTNPRVLEHRVQKEKEYSRRFKLKYKEQLAKKEFFGLLLSDPERITHEDNEAFLQSNLRAKADLKATKSDLERYYAGINENSLRVESRVEIVKAKLVQGSRTIQAIKEMKRELAMLRATLPAHKRMTLPQLNDTLEAQDAQLVALNEEESSVKERIAVEKTSLSQLVKRLEGLGPERVKAESTARQLQASAADQKAEIMELCGWNRGVIELYSRLFDVQTLVAASENELQIPYAGEPPYTLSLVFNPATRRLGTAQVLGYDEDISELVELAVDSDDIAGLIRDVRAHVQRSYL